MKGIVVEYNQKDAIVLTDDGLFARVKNNNYEIGQAIQVEEIKKIRSRLVAGAASLAAALAITVTGGIAYFTPTDYVSLDVNPSVEYTLNMFDRVLDVDAVNEDGELILSGLDMNNMVIGDAVKKTLDELIAEGYLADDPNGGVIIATSNKKIGKAETLAVELEQEVRDYFVDKENVTAKVKAEAVGTEKVQEAKDLGVTPGKLNLVEKLESSTNGSINRDEWLNMPVKEINKAIKENRQHKRDNGRQDWEHRDHWNYGDIRDIDKTKAEDKKGIDIDDNDNTRKTYKDFYLTHREESGDFNKKTRDKDKNSSWNDEKSDKDTGRGKDKKDDGGGRNNDQNSNNAKDSGWKDNDRNSRDADRNADWEDNNRNNKDSDWKDNSRNNKDSDKNSKWKNDQSQSSKRKICRLFLYKNRILI